MRKRAKTATFVLAALIAGTLAILTLQSREPGFRGRSLTYWLQQYADAPLNEQQPRADAEKAVRTMGAQRILPHLLAMAKAQNGPIRSWVLRKNEQWNLRALRLKDASDVQLLAVAGFEMLGTNGAEAVPQLTCLMADTNRAFTALRCLVGIGEPAEASACQALTNQVPSIRAFAASQLACVMDDIDVYLAKLKGPLNDPDATVRFAAVQALGLQTESLDQVIPLLLTAAHDPQESIAGYAVKFLGNLRTNAVTTFDSLSNIVETGNAYMSSHALGSLLSIAPERAMPMVIAWLHSPKAELRARAVSILARSPDGTRETLELLKQARLDIDHNVAERATAALRQYRNKEREPGSKPLIIDGEPSCEGMQLGEWLRRDSRANEWSSDVKDAIGRMGTNAIPSLLARLVYVDQKFGLPDEDARVEATGALIVLGDQALSALPKLEELINGDDPSIALFALMAGSNAGTNSLPLVIRALKNQHADVRNQALCLFGEDASPCFRESRNRVLPAISNLLQDSDEFARMNATNILRQILHSPTPRTNFKSTE